MRETLMSTLEREFLLSSLSESKRLDGRSLTDRRDLKLRFGSQWGTAHVTLGETQVMARVSCSLTEPTASKPNEGTLKIQVDFSSVAAPRFTDRGVRSGQEEENVEINRILERCLKESRCLDMESLCVIAEEKVWCIRLDLRILNHEGNVADACSVAGLAALCHFRRPEVSLKGDQITVHPTSERDPVQLAVHHHPVCSTFAFFNIKGPSATSSIVSSMPPPLSVPAGDGDMEGSSNGDGKTREHLDSTPETPAVVTPSAIPPPRREQRIVCVDPSWQEEAVMDGKIVFGVNPYREICTLHLAGNMLIDKSVVLRYAQSAAQHSKSVVDMIKNKLAADIELRKKLLLENLQDREVEPLVGLARAFRDESILALNVKTKEIRLDNLTAETSAAMVAAATTASATINSDGEEIEEDEEEMEVNVKRRRSVKQK